MKRSPIKRRSAPHRTTAIRTRNRKRKAANLERAHGPAERREWIKTLPCANCGIVGYSEGAHIKNGGMSKKADARFTIPLCGRVVGVIGCHGVQHSFGWSALVELNTPDKREAAAARTEELWQSHLRQTGRET